MKTCVKRLLSMILALTMIVGMVPAVSAEGTPVEVSDSAAFVTAMGNGNDITVAGPIDLQAVATVPNGKTVILDLNGQTITSTKGIGAYIRNEGNLTIRDSKGGGKISVSCPNNDATSFYSVYSNGNLTLESGEIALSVDNGGSAYTIYNKSGNLTITGGTVKAERGSINCYKTTHLLGLGGNGTVSISNANFEATSQNPSNDTRTALMYLLNSATPTITIESGTFKADGHNNTGGAILRNNGTANANAKLYIKGGDFTGVEVTTTKGLIDLQGTKPTTIQFSGGTFSATVDAKYLAEGCTQAANGTVAFNVDSSDALIAAMQNGGSIRLTADIALTATATVPAGKTAILDLNGKTISSNSEVNRVENNGTLTIIDSREGGKDGEIIITPANDAATVMAVKNTGNLTIEGGKFTASGKVKTVYTVYSVAPSVTINGGTFKATYTGGKSLWGSAHALVLCGDGSDSAAATINGGTFIAETTNPENTRCASIYAGGGIADKISIVINDGNFEGKRTAARSASAIRFMDKTSSASVVINGGNFAANIVSGAIDDRLFANSFGNLTITGGSFTYDGKIFTDARKATITGGTFVKADGTKNDISTYVSEGYEQNASGEVVAKSAAPTHSHKLCNDAACADHAVLTFEPWTSKTTLPTTAGNYYLTEDVQLSIVWNLKANVNLCLNGHTITAPKDSAATTDKDERDRTVALNAGYTLSVTDHDNTGKITGGVRNYGGVINVNAGATFNLFGGQLTGNKAKDNNGNGQAGAVYLSAGTDSAVGGTFNMYGGVITKNTAYNGGAIYASKYSVINIHGGSITENTATNGSGAVLLNLGCTFNMTGGSITNNTSAIEGGAITTTSAIVSVSGKAVITDNKAGSVASNVYMKNSGLLAVGAMDASAKIGVSAATPVNGMALSAALGGANVVANFISDNDDYEIAVKDDKLVLKEKVYHKHNLNDCNAHDADVNFLPWESTTSLPTTAGNYFLTGDVQLKNVWNLKANVNLCLNGHTITAPKDSAATTDKDERDRTVALNAGYTLSVTDHDNTGKITGGVRNYGGVINVNAGATFNLYGGQLTGNTTKDPTGGDGQGGAIYLSAASGAKAGGVFNMYGGSINNNVAYRGGAIYMLKGTTFNMYGGAISNNTAKNRSGAIFAASTATINIYGGEISDNSCSSIGGAIGITNKTVLTMTGGKITGSTGTYGGAIYIEGTGTKMVMSGGEISGSTGTEGGAIYAGAGTIFEMSGGKIFGNKGTKGGAMELVRATANISGGEIFGNTVTNQGGAIEVEGATLTVTGGKISGNTAVNGGGIYIANNGEANQPSVTLAGGEISGNTASGVGGGVATKDDKYTKLELSGDLVIKDNKAAGKVSNLYLPGKAVFTVGEMGANAKIGISAKRVSGAMSAKTQSDCTAAFFSDNSVLKVVYKDSTVYLEPTDGHAHCLCNDKSASCKDHGTTVFTPWSDPKSLPTTAGSYYLTVDVQLSSVCIVSGKVDLCLNGHTVTAPANERTFAANPGSVLSVTDCADSGKITGGVRNYGGVINVNQGATFNLYGGNLTGNKVADEDSSSKGRSGAIFLTAETATQPGGVFNMYGGTISENQANLGGAIFMNAGTVFNMYGGTITNNNATSKGGAISNEGKCTINIYGGVISENTSKQGGAARLVHASSLNIYGGEITGNTATSVGGAFLLESKNTEMIMTGGKISGNSANEGGAIYASRNTIMEISGGEFNANTSKKNGGALYLLQANVTINGGTFSKNESSARGGAINNGGESTLIMNGGIITENKAKNGAAISIANASTFTMTDGVITKNTASSAGGAILMESTDSKMTMSGGEITENTGGSGGAVYVSIRTIFEMTGGKIEKNSGKKYGGALYLQQSTATIRGGSISYNNIRASGGQGAAIKADGSTLNIYGGTINGNYFKHEKNSGGAAIATYKTIEKKNGVEYTYYTKINMYGGTISNHTGRSGGAMQLLAKTTFNMYGGTFRNNEAVLYGGVAAMYSEATFNMYGGTIANNKAAKQGGGLYYTTGSVATLSGGTAYGNVSGSDGGFLWAYGNTSKITMKNMKIYGNEAAAFGGGIAMMMQSELDMDDCELYENTANKGGAFYLAHKTVAYVDGTKYYKNTSNEGGGAIYLDVGGSHYFTNVKILDNKAGKSGGGAVVRSNVTFTDCLIDGNEAVASGGGIATGSAWTYNNQYTNGYVGRGQGTILVNTTFSNNTCSATGGGIYMGPKNWNEIIDCTFTGNESGENGAAVFIKDDLKVVGMTVTDNTSKNDGYAVWYDVNNYDGVAYNHGIFEMGGNVVVKDNNGGDMMLSENVVLCNIVEGYGKDTFFNVTLTDSVLTKWILGEYDYEGEDLNYTITYGSRSYTEPMVSVNVEEAESKGIDGNVWLYAGVGVFAAAVIAAVVLIVLKKKKAGKPAEMPQE